MVKILSVSCRTIEVRVALAKPLEVLENIKTVGFHAFMMQASVIVRHVLFRGQRGREPQDLDRPRPVDPLVFGVADMDIKWPRGSHHGSQFFIGKADGWHGGDLNDSDGSE